MISTHLKNISQIGNLPQVGVTIKNIWNQHLDHQRNCIHFVSCIILTDRDFQKSKNAYMFWARKLPFSIVGIYITNKVIPCSGWDDHSQYKDFRPWHMRNSHEMFPTKNLKNVSSPNHRGPAPVQVFDPSRLPSVVKFRRLRRLRGRSSVSQRKQQPKGLEIWLVGCHPCRLWFFFFVPTKIN